MDSRSTVHALAAAALLVVPACASADRKAGHGSDVHVWKSPRIESALPMSYDAQAEQVAFRVELPKCFTREACVQVEATNDGSEPVFVWTLDGRMILGGERRFANGFFSAGGNFVYCREGTALARLDPGESIRGSVTIEDFLGHSLTVPPSLEGEVVQEQETVEGEFRLVGEFHSREHAATGCPTDCDGRRLASPSFVVPLTEWKR